MGEYSYENLDPNTYSYLLQVVIVTLIFIRKPNDSLRLHN